MNEDLCIEEINVDLCSEMYREIQSWDKELLKSHRVRKSTTRRARSSLWGTEPRSRSGRVGQWNGAPCRCWTRHDQSSSFCEHNVVYKPGNNIDSYVYHAPGFRASRLVVCTLHVQVAKNRHAEPPGTEDCPSAKRSGRMRENALFGRSFIWFSCWSLLYRFSSLRRIIIQSKRPLSVNRG